MPRSVWTASAAKNGRASSSEVRHPHAEAGALRTYALVLGCAAAVVALDQATKQIALTELAGGPIEVIEGALTLRLTFNSGGAFGVGQGLPLLFLLASVVIAGLILGWARRVRDGGVAVALGLILGGGLGNLWDRLFRDLGGRVVDFVDLHVWPVFNLADACIVLGVAGLLWTGMRGRGRPAG